jgi:[acyl-carrier-protein] S-malonyltransferase
MREPVPIGLLFPGQLAELPGMGRDFLEEDREGTDLLGASARACGVEPGVLLAEQTHPGPRGVLAAQTGVFLVSVLAARALERHRVEPTVLAGYSLGHYASLWRAGAISFEDCLRILVAVWEQVESQGVQGTMGAVIGCPGEEIDAACDEQRRRGSPVWVGSVNAPGQIVLTGSEAGVEGALSRLKPASLSVQRLAMTWPIHSELLAPVSAAVAPIVASCESIRAPRLPTLGPDADSLETADDVRRILTWGFSRANHWNRVFATMVSRGTTRFLEAGPGQMLSRVARWIAREADCRPAGTAASAAEAADIIARGWTSARPS